MGIYAALFDAGVVSFETGLELIRLAYHAMLASIKNGPFGMGTLIGLNRKDIQQLIDQSGLRIEITNQNASHSFVVSGFGEDITKLLEHSKAEGALHVRDLDVSIPYHSRFLTDGAIDFEQKIKHLRFSAPRNQIVSLIDQTILTTGESMRHEVIRNLFHPLNWFNTNLMMLKQDITVFVECGPSKGLIKNAKFVDGNYRFYTLGSMPLR